VAGADALFATGADWAGVTGLATVPGTTVLATGWAAAARATGFTDVTAGAGDCGSSEPGAEATAGDGDATAACAESWAAGTLPGVPLTAFTA
jgi:hypothetical protein